MTQEQIEAFAVRWQMICAAFPGGVVQLSARTVGDIMAALALVLGHFGHTESFPFMQRMADEIEADLASHYPDDGGVH